MQIETLLQDKEREVKSLESRIEVREAEGRALHIETLLQDKEREVKSLMSRIEVAERALQIETLLQNKEREVKSLKSRIDDLHQLNEELRNSNSWKITAPLRVIVYYTKQILRHLHSGIRNTVIGAGRFVLPFVPIKYRTILKASVYRKLGWLLSEEVSQKISTNQLDIVRARESIPVLRDFGEQPEQKILNAKIAVHVHIFYVDLAEEFVSLLDNMPFTFDLFISTTSNKAKLECIDAFGRIRHLGKLVVKKVPNRGRDIAPFIVTFGDSLKDYDYVSHLHTKKSLYNSGKTDGWREYLLDNLFGTEVRLRQIFSVFINEPETGLIYPQNYFRLPYAANTWLANRGQGQAWGKRLGIHQIPEGYFNFPAGDRKSVV